MDRSRGRPAFYLYRFLLQSVLFVLWPLLGFAARWFPGGGKRVAFERRNREDPFSRPFALDGLKAQAAFEVSSEGELEQVRPLIEELLNRKKRVELVYCSPSVEKTCRHMAAQSSGFLRILRLPLVTYRPYSPWSFTRWVTASPLVLCRYDFFPELLLFGLKPSRTFILVSATLKNHVYYGRGKSFGRKILLRPFVWFWRELYSSFDFCVAATGRDEELLREELRIPGNKTAVFDFRIIQIFRRLNRREETLGHQTFFPPFRAYLSGFPLTRRMIFGSFWPVEASVFSSPPFRQDILAGKLQVTILPHDLGERSVEEVKASLLSATLGEIPLYFIGGEKGKEAEEGEPFFRRMAERPGILVIFRRGILCELYSLFGHAFVGGGHGRSIHSVLEPFLAQSRVYMGPNVHRSTEYDFISSLAPGEVHVVGTPADFYPLHYLPHQDGPLQLERRKDLLWGGDRQLQAMMEKLLGEGDHVTKQEF